MPLYDALGFILYFFIMLLVYIVVVVGAVDIRDRAADFRLTQPAL